MRLDVDLPERTALTAPLVTPKSRANCAIALFTFSTALIFARFLFSVIVCEAVKQLLDYKYTGIQVFKCQEIKGEKPQVIDSIDKNLKPAKLFADTWGQIKSFQNHERERTGLEPTIADVLERACGLL